MNEIIRHKYGQRGEGSLILRPACANWLYQYFFKGKLHEETTGSTDLKAARRFVKDRREKIGAHRQGVKKFIPASQQKATVGELLDALIVDYRNRARKSLPQILSHVKRIREHFGHFKAGDVTGRLVDDYIADRRTAGDPSATINRGTQILAQAYRRELKQDQSRVLSAPTINRLPEDNARQGFFEPVEVTAVCHGLPDVLADFFRFEYLTAWRPGDLKALKWEYVEGDSIKLPDSKNGKPKSLSVVGDLISIMKRREAARLLETPDGNVRLAEHVFHRNGQPIADYRDAWFRACKKAGFTTLKISRKSGKTTERVTKYLYDGKRSAVRNLVRAGVSERVVLDVAGIRSASILARYNISSDTDKRLALESVRLPVST